MTQHQQSKSVNSLPQPDAEAAAHCDRVRQRLLEKIAVTGSISFTDYMQTVLYEPGLGYYSAGCTKLGAQGDFITAPEISSLFSRSVAQAITPALDAIHACNILEVGAGSGTMAVDILLFLDNANKLPEHYYILELSADLRLRQQQHIKQTLPALYHRVVWLEALPQNLNAVVLANELLDAMPVVRFKKEQDGISIEHVIHTGNHFNLSYQPCIESLDNANTANRLNQRVIERVKKIESEIAELNPGYKSEINFNAEDWISSLAEHLHSGIIILIDYGYPQHEYYHEQRNKGSLTCFYRHRHHDNPFVYPGLQDLTAHVDFTAMADSAINAGLNVMGYTTQSGFLFGAGIAQLAEQSLNDCTDDSADEQNIVAHIEMANKIKKLTMPYEMGEIVKVIGFSKNCHVSLTAFAFNDMRDHL